jgi:hypothetical protein
MVECLSSKCKALNSNPVLKGREEGRMEGRKEGERKERKRTILGNRR